MKKRIWSIIMAITMLLSSIPAVFAEGSFTVTDLKVNQMENPMTVDQQTPSFTWRMESVAKGVYQTAYQLRVLLGEVEVWNTGKVESDTAQATYAGETLLSTERYSWEITVWNQAGESAKAASWFETAFMDSAEFDAPLISATEVTGYTGDYTLEYKTTLEGKAAGVIFSAVNSNDFFWIQLNNGKSAVEVHRTANSKDSNLFAFSKTLAVDTVYTVRLEVVGTTGTLYLDNEKLGSFTNDGLHFGKLGLRHMNTSSDQDSAYYDDLKVTAANGNVLLDCDFSSANPFAVGSLVNGQLYAGPLSTNWRVMDYSYSLAELKENLSASYIGDYTVEYDVQVPSDSSASFIFAGTDSSNFVSLQVNAKKGKYQIITHTAGKGAGKESLTASGLDQQLHIKIEVKGTTATVYSNNTKILTHTNAALMQYGVFGFRHYNSSTDQETAYYDNLVITAADGSTLMRFDFEARNPFKTGTIEEGRLRVAPISGNVSVSTMEELTAVPADNFTIETDFKVQSGALGVVFGGSDSRNLLFWQINLAKGASEEKVLLRPHSISGGSASGLGDIDISAQIPWSARNDWHTLKLEINAGEIKTYINGTLVDTRTNSLSTMTQIGFRLTKSDGEIAWIDNYKLTNSEGVALISADFEDHLDPFGTGRTKDGALYLEKCGLFTRDVEQKGAPMFRTEFALDSGKTVEKARLYASSLGTYLAYINGQTVSEDQLAPGWTEYFDRIDYQAYDVTDLLQSGSNAIGAVVGNGWYAGHVGEGNSNYEYYGKDVAFKSQLIITYTDGTEQVIKTDNSWVYSTESPYLVTDHSNGETYDARYEQPGWNTAGFDASDWKGANIATSDSINTQLDLSAVEWTAQSYEPVRVFKTITPVRITKVGEDAYIADMGQNFAGVVTLKATGVKGQTLRLRYGEMLYDENDGELEGQLYTANLRTAHATDYYVFGADGTVEYTPYFTYHGFRYVEISGLGYEPKPEEILGVVWSNVSTITSSLDTSSDLVDQIYSNTMWSQLSNYVSVPTDCPQRDERLGWTGDAQVFAGTATINSDVYAFLNQYLSVLFGKQGANGGLPSTAPTHSAGKSSGADAGWTDAAIIIPYVLYKNYGNTEVIETYFDNMAAYIGRLLEKAGYASTGNLVIDTHTYGDWLSSGETTPKVVLTTAYLGYDLRLMAEMAAVIGKTEEVAYYQALFEETSEQFKDKFVTSDGLIFGDSQTAYALSLGTGVLNDPALERKAAARLNEKVVANGNKLTTGFLGTNFLCTTLAQYGYADTAYALLLQTEYPSWGYSVVNGATTIWERWNSYTAGGGLGANSQLGSTMNSYNHYCYGSIVQWIFEEVAGIAADPEEPGYKHIIMKPLINDSLSFINASYDSQYGKITSHWAIEDGRYTWTVTVPANASATVYAPGKGVPTEQECVAELGNYTYKILSGTYTFTGSVEEEADVAGLETALEEADFYLDNFADTKSYEQAVKNAEEYLASGVYANEATASLLQALEEGKAALSPISKATGSIPSMKDYTGEAAAYQITTVSEWLYFDQLVESGVSFEGKTVYLMNNLDFENIQMTGIGAYSDNYAAAFKGTFEGGYHMLKNVNIYNSGKGSGAFDVTYAATVRCLGVSGSVTGSSVVGGIAGYADGASTIENCWNEARILSINSSDGCAGIAGNVRNAGTVKKCYNVGKVVGINYAAGICSWGQGGTAKIIDCYNMGELIASDNGSTTNAIVRYNKTTSGNTSNCYYISTEPGSETVTGTLSATAAQFTDGTVANALGMAQGEYYPVFAETILNGDLDGDGNLTTADAVLLLRHLVGYEVEFKDDPDVSGDGKISIFDAVKLMQSLS
ncbi:MAG: family 78 glycoside hydrolase catalytic domain [Clostridia bacterium]|nr:family 78 glycoside hydrolase catalytic domain [Clostridia bacterium]